MPTVDTAAVTQRGIDILSEALPDAEVAGQYDDDVDAWTWTAAISFPSPTEEDPDAITVQGASRQFVSTTEMPEPSDEYLGLVATEIASTFPTGVTA